MTQYGTWVPYEGVARGALAVVMAAAAVGLIIAGTRLGAPIRMPSTSRRIKVTMIALWILAILSLPVGVSFYVRQAIADNLLKTPPADPISIVTDISVCLTFVIITVIGNQIHLRARTFIPSAAIGALAAPLVFELPFDLAVMSRTYPALPPNPSLYRGLVFGPLIFIELTTIALLMLSPMVSLSRGTIFALGAMFAVFAVWALFGFDYPSAATPIALNVTSKILAFVATICLFIPRSAAQDSP